MQATYVEVSAGVRYWEDATINGTTDTDGKLTPLRKGDNWAADVRGGWVIESATPLLAAMRALVARKLGATVRM